MTFLGLWEANVNLVAHSGAKGIMRSLHSFVESRGLDRAVRFDLNPPSLQEVDVKTTQGMSVHYQLESFPLYCAEFLLGE